jgi:hypothetical protein
MNGRNKNFFALLAMLESSQRSKRHTPAWLTANSIVRHQLLPVLRVAFKMNPEKDIEQILEISAPALADVIEQIVEP